MDPMIIGIAVVALSLLLAVLVWLKNSSEKDVKQRPKPRQDWDIDRLSPFFARPKNTIVL